MEKIRNYPTLFLLLVPVIIFYSFFFSYTVNAPINDDYHAILYFLNDFVSADTYKEKLTLLLAQHNEHRILYNRLITILMYKLTGTINFNMLALIGNLSLIPLCLLLYYQFLRYRKPLILFLPVVIFLFNLAFWENITFAMAAMSNFTVYSFIVLSIYFLTRDDLDYKKTLLSFIFFTCALYTQGGGIALLPVIAFILIFRRKYIMFVIFISLSILLLLGYFYNFQNTQAIDLMSIFYDYKGKVLIFILAFLGNAFNYFLIYSNQATESTIITASIGLLLFSLFVYITKTRYYKKNLFNYGIMLTVVVMAFITAVSRINFEVEMSGHSRYRLNGVILLIAIYFWYIENNEINRKKIFFISLLALCYFFAINLTHYEYLSFRKKSTLTAILFYNDGNNSYLTGDKSSSDNFTQIMMKSQNLNIYHFPTEELDSYFPIGQKINNTLGIEVENEFVSSINNIDTLAHSYFIEGMGFLMDLSANKQQLFVGLKGEKDIEPVFFSSRSISRYDLNPYFNKFNLKNGGFICRINKNDVNKGDNKVYLKIIVDNKVKIKETDKIISK